jgi:hypothetical protein
MIAAGDQFPSELPIRGRFSIFPTTAMPRVTRPDGYLGGIIGTEIAD